MKQLNEYIVEKLIIDKNVKKETTKENLKKLVKLNGFSIPGSFEFNEKEEKFIYASSKGFRGDTLLSDIRDKLKNAGWKSLKDFNTVKNHPAGNWIEYFESYISPDKKVVFNTDKYFGETSASNRYRGEFETAEHFSKINNYDKF